MCRVLAIALGLGLVAPGAVGAAERGSEDFRLRSVEALHLDDVHPGPDGLRVVDVYFRALTGHGEPVEHLRPVDVEIFQDEERVDVEDVTLRPLGETDRGVACVLALDVSRTMKGEPFERARGGALQLLDRLGSHDRAAVVAFGGSVEVVAPFRASRGEKRVQLESLGIESEALSTVLHDGVHRSLEMIREGRDLPRRAFVVVFSDGKDAGSTHSLESVIELARGSGTEVRVLVFGIGYARFGGGGLEVLRRLSRETGASFLEARSALRLDSFFDDVWSQMMGSYVARFPSSLDGEAHGVRVAVEGEEATRTALYPDRPRPWWPWLAGGGVLAAAGLGAWAMAQRRSPGRLVFVGGPRAGESVALRPGRLRIGALPDNDVVLASETVSRYHAEVRVEGRRVGIQDLRSRNGTQVNGKPVRESPLQPGDRVRIADLELVYER